jgi:hypothetical protein
MKNTSPTARAKSPLGMGTAKSNHKTSKSSKVRFQTQSIKDCDLAALDLPNFDDIDHLNPVYRAHSTALGLTFDLIARQSDGTFMARVKTDDTSPRGEYGTVFKEDLKQVPFLFIMKYKKHFDY